MFEAESSLLDRTTKRWSISRGGSAIVVSKVTSHVSTFLIGNNLNCFSLVINNLDSGCKVNSVNQDVVLAMNNNTVGGPK